MSRMKSRGKTRDNGLFSIGRQAQMIPVFASMVVQIVETYVPYVGSLLFEPAFRVVIRNTDVTHTLSAMSKE